MTNSKTVVQREMVVTNERWSFTRGSNCNNLTGKMLVVSISVIKVDTYARRSVTRGGRTWMFDCI